MERKHSFSLQCMIRKGRKNRKDEYPVYLRMTVGGIRAEIATNVMASMDKWNASKGRLNGTIPQTRASNRQLDIFEHKAREIYNRLLLDGKSVTAEGIKNEITGVEHRARTLVASFEAEVIQMESREGSGFTKGTIKNWKVTLRHLKQFLQTHFGIEDISFRQIDHQFILDLDWFARTKWNCRTNAVLKHFQRIQKVIKIAINRGWIQKNPFSSFNCKQEKTHRTFLTPDELKSIETKIFPLKRLENVKDVFLFSCYTGLAYVDIEQLSLNNLKIGVDGKQWIYTFRQKTNNKSNVPLLPQALKIIEKYKDYNGPCSRGSLLPMITNIKTNAYLKEIADICGITKNLTFHMARHTFATTITLSNGVPMETVSNML
ncbi:MAG: site-specific integrase, partial [Ferruginibacter sp.]